MALLAWGAVAAGGVAASSDSASAPTGAVSSAHVIDAANVHRLALVSSFRFDRVGAEAGPPVFAAGTLLVLTSFPHTLFALDPSAPPAERVRWQYTPPADRRADGLACCDASRHGPVVDGGQVYFTTLDGRVVSLDLEGQPRWSVAVADLAAGEVLAGPPTVADGRVFVGGAGSDNGARGWIAALDAATGRLLWRRYSAGTDADVGVGQGFAPRSPRHVGKDLGTSTWPPGATSQSGGGVAAPILVDKATGLVFHETGHAAPWNADQRPGENLWTSGLFARDPVSGLARWFIGFNPHSPFAYREGADLLVDRDGPGPRRHVLVHADANGFVYVLDRRSGEVVAADPFVDTVVAGVSRDGETTYRPDTSPRVNRQSRDICPSWTGAVGGAVSSIDATRVLIALNRMCMDIEPRTANYLRGTPYLGANVRLAAPWVGGGVMAWDLDARRPAWLANERFPVLGGLLATPENLVFYGTLDRQFKALDARTGAPLWSAGLPAGVLSQPAAFVARDGRQMVAVVAGTGRLFGLSRREALDSRDPSAGMGLSGIARLLPANEDPSGTLLIFALP